jgi:hypothetical protein
VVRASARWQRDRIGITFRRLSMTWKSTIAAAAVLSMSVATATLAAAPTTLTGKISDAMCKGKHDGDAKQCVEKCIKGGDKYVLVVDTKIYAISNQKFADLAKFAGDTAVVTGDVKDDTITISKMAAPKK